MRNTFFALCLSILAVLSPDFALAQTSTDYEEILVKIDKNTLFTGDLSATATLEQRDPDNGDDLSRVQMFRRDSNNTFLMLFEKPETKLGQGYLNIDDGLWFYDPESRQFSYTSISESFGGTDARNSDFEASSLASDYDVVSASEGTLGKFEVWILELEASNNEVSYPFRKIWVTKEPNLILKSEDYSLTKRLLRTSYFPNYAKTENSYIASESLFVDALVDNKSTKISLENISTNMIPDNVFTKAYVERVNR
jgi:outer membrane lipoprotein-sorting protein